MFILFDKKNYFKINNLVQNFYNIQNEIKFEHFPRIERPLEKMLDIEPLVIK